MDLIYENTSLDKKTCCDIINLFEKNELKAKGNTLGGLFLNVKDTTDLIVNSDFFIKYPEWSNVKEILHDELKKNMTLYLKRIGNVFKLPKLMMHGFQIQKYEKKKGKYLYHNDFDILFESMEFRAIAFIWYLNDVDIGGETEFFNGKIKIKPEVGKLLLFPSLWTYPHSGLIPLSSDKYIITGWLYAKWD